MGEGVGYEKMRSNAPDSNDENNESPTFALPEKLDPEIREELHDQVFELLNPQSGDLLREVVKREMFNEAKDPITRDAEVVKRGYKPDGLRDLGDRMIKKAEVIKNHKEEDAWGGDITWREMEELPILAFSGTEDNPTRHSNITVGATAELSRQMRKLMSASIEDIHHLRQRAVTQPDAEITSENVYKFIDMLHNVPEIVNSRQREFLERAGSNSKVTQYKFAKAMLNRSSAKLR